MRRNPFYRTFRVCKLTLSALEGALRLFLEPERLPETHRIMTLMTTPVEKLRLRADALVREINGRFSPKLVATTSEELSQVGGGSLAGYELPTAVVRVTSPAISPDAMARSLRLSDPPVFARVRQDALLLDIRTVFPEEDHLLLDVLGQVQSRLQGRSA